VIYKNILITRCDLPVVFLLKNFFESKKIKVSINTSFSYIDSDSSSHLIIHFAGFTSVQNETLFSTSYLKKIIDHAKTSNSKLIYFYNPKNSKFSRKSLQEVSRYFVKHGLPYRLVPIKQSLSIYQILDALELSNPSVRPINLIYKILIFLFIIPWILLPVYSFIFYSLFHCSWQALNTSRWNLGKVCSQSGIYMANFVSPQLPLFVLPEYLLTKLGYSPSAVISLLSDYFQISAKTTTFGQSFSAFISPFFNPDVHIDTNSLPTSQAELIYLSQSLTSFSTKLTNYSTHQFQNPISSQISSQIPYYQSAVKDLQKLVNSL
jgi:hypothetical protein